MKNLHWLQQQSPIRLSQEEAREVTEQVLWLKFCALVLKMKGKRTPKWRLREISPESKNPAKKMGFTTNMPLFLRAFDCTMIAREHCHQHHLHCSQSHGRPHHDHLDHYHHVRLNLPSFSQRNPLIMCPPTAATAPTLRKTSFKVKTSPIMILRGIGIPFI